MVSDTPLEHRDVPGALDLDGVPVRLHVVLAGPKTGTPVVLLHGFPECWHGWRHQIAALAAAGYRVVAPDLRGYNQSSKPRGRVAYRIDTLVADIHALVTQLDLGPCHLVGHDWGGAVAWEVAAAHPEILRTLTIANCPRAHVLMGAVRGSLSQLKRSWYILAFQPPLLGEGWLKALGPRRLFRSTSAPGTFSDADLAVYAKAWAEPRALTAMLNYYRANLLHPPSSAKARITTPTLVLWGTNDLALGTALIAPSLATCDDAKLIELQGVSHWSPAEAAPAFNAGLLAHLETHGGADPLVYKLVPAAEWENAAKPWVGSADDLRDGFIHLSARSQVSGTLKAHFAEAGDLLALAVDPARLPSNALRWEESRSGKRFPHLYAPLSSDAVVATHAIAKDDSGHVLPESW